MERNPWKLQKCHQAIYSQPQASDETPTDYVFHCSDLPPSHNESLLQPVSAKEFNSAVSKLEAGKSSGSDGFTRVVEISEATISSFISLKLFMGSD